MSRHTIPCLLAVLLTAACAGSQRSSKQRYVDAIHHKQTGNTQAAYDGLIALAHQSPDTRAGRRARAILTSGSILLDAAIVSSAAAAVWPSFAVFGNRAKQSEARVGLKALAAALQAFRAENGFFCTTFDECQWQPPGRAIYLYYLDRDEVIGGTGLQDPDLVRLKAEAAIGSMNMRPHVKRDAFLVVAVGDPDQDGALDIWSIDENNNLLQLLKD